MDEPTPLSRSEADQLRAKHYNATVVAARRVHDQLLVLRVAHDAARFDFAPGQYVSLGRGAWEKLVAGAREAPLAERRLRHLVQRAYSLSGTLLDEAGRLLRATDDPHLEIYLTLVPDGVARTPGLTHRLFALEAGDRLYVSPRAHGNYTLDPVQPGDQVVFVSTGTGEAPHNAMLAELLARGHAGRIVSVCCARLRRDLAYLEKHRQLERRFGNYQYVPLTTREPENLDLQRAGYVGKRYVQDFFESGEFEQQTDCRLDPRTTHVFLCGNPAMIGLPQRGAAAPSRRGMIDVLQQRGFEAEPDQPPGHLHYEKYW